MEELKKCPFCGGIARFRVTRYGTISSGVQIDFAISCSQCGAGSPEANKSLAVTMNETGEIMVRNDGRDMAVYEWNKRAETNSNDPSNTDPTNDPNSDPSDPTGGDPSSDPTGDP